MYQFFVESDQISNKTVVITGHDVNHIKNVLRMKSGEEIAVSNGVDGKEYRCMIREIGEESITCDLLFIREEGLELPSKVYLFQGLPKGDKMEWIIQKAVELGVHEIIPVSTKRSIVKWDAKKSANKTARWQTIAEAAAKQSKRQMIPRIKEVMTMAEAVLYAGEIDIKLIPYELAQDMVKTREIIDNLHPGQSIAIFIGPEGGFEEKEVNMALEAGMTAITMGKRILRTETAGMTILGWIMYQLEL